MTDSRLQIATGLAAATLLVMSLPIFANGGETPEESSSSENSTTPNLLNVSSPAARTALERYTARLEQAQEKYLETVSRARDFVTADLKKAKQVAIAQEDEDEAENIRKAIVSLTIDSPIELPDLEPPAVLLTSSAAQNIVQDQLASLNVSDEGEISTDFQNRSLTLHGTEEKKFVLTGEVRFAGNLSDVHQGGIEFFLRQRDSRRRYELSGIGLRSKRRVLSGEPTDDLRWTFRWSNIEVGVWYSFYLYVGHDEMRIRIGGEQEIVEGPLSTDGINKIYFRPGGAVRNVRLDIYD